MTEIQSTSVAFDAGLSADSVEIANTEKLYRENEDKEILDGWLKQYTEQKCSAGQLAQHSKDDGIAASILPISKPIKAPKRSRKSLILMKVKQSVLAHSSFLRNRYWKHIKSKEPKSSKHLEQLDAPTALASSNLSISVDNGNHFSKMPGTLEKTLSATHKRKDDFGGTLQRSHEVENIFQLQQEPSPQIYVNQNDDISQVYTPEVDSQLNNFSWS